MFVIGCRVSNWLVPSIILNNFVERPREELHDEVTVILTYFRVLQIDSGDMNIPVHAIIISQISRILGTNYYKFLFKDILFAADTAIFCSFYTYLIQNNK